MINTMNFNLAMTIKKHQQFSAITWIFGVFGFIKYRLGKNIETNKFQECRAKMALL